ncbi:MAG: pyridoxamine 5'-phosphate oxidase family protein, partial [Gammaproteobacteria bacterium]|nr:pyridoxamine 5'-phosphate oxidase family protein [Gammaproteobacteria bacterium]
AVLYCTGSRITDDKEFDYAFEVLIDQLEDGRWQQVRVPSKQERKGTALLKLQINEASYKSRTGGPSIDKADEDIPVWTGTTDVCPFHKA